MHYTLNVISRIYGLNASPMPPIHLRQLSELILHKSSGSICGFSVCDCVFSSIQMCVCLYLTTSNFSIRNDEANEKPFFFLYFLFTVEGKSQCAMFMHIFGHKINVLFLLCYISIYASARYFIYIYMCMYTHLFNTFKTIIKYTLALDQR